VACIKPPVRLMAVSLVPVFTLTACSSGGTVDSEGTGSADESAENTESSNVFDFTESTMGPAEAIEFRIPDELIEKDLEYSENRLVDSVTLTAAEAEDPSRCAVRYDFGYADGDLERLTEFAANRYGPGEEKEAAFHALTNESPDDTDIEEDFSSAVVQLSCALSPSDDSDTTQVRFAQTNDKDGSTLFIMAEVSVMSSGELFVHGTEARSWQVDSNGNWVKG
jgi:hypothetical protein